MSPPSPVIDLTGVVPAARRAPTAHTAGTTHSAPSPTALARLRGPILLATDGADPAGHAAHAALAVARRIGAAVEVVSVLDTRGVPLPPPLDVALALGDELVGPGVHDAEADALRGRLSAALGERVDWPVHVALGVPGPAIAQRAAERDVGLTVVGLRRHGALGRALQDETAVQVMRRATCPVLAVTPAFVAPPRHVVVALDFSRTSLAAARLALDLLASGGTLTLAHATGAFDEMLEEGERHVRTLGIAAAFDALVRALAPPPDVTVDRVVLDEPMAHPSPAHRLLAYADGAHADLLALGSRRHGRVERWMLGSVVTDVVRDGRLSVLVVPPAE